MQVSEVSAREKSEGTEHGSAEARDGQGGEWVNGGGQEGG